MTPLLIVGIIFAIAMVSLYFEIKYPAPAFPFTLPEWPYMPVPYTPQAYLEDIRNHIWECNTSLSPQQRAALKSVPIIYKALSQAPNEIIGRQAAETLATLEGVPLYRVYGLHMGVTDKASYDDRPGAKELFVFGCDHRHDQEEMAKTLVHELGHVVSSEGHDEQWARNVQMLGLLEKAYGDKPKRMNLDDPHHLLGPWLDKKLEAYVHSLPQVDWGDIDADAEICFRNALARMKGR
jgi:hypothetical protein